MTEIFGSFQGEGVHTGRATTFIRLAGCNLDCDWCDTRYSRDPSSGKDMGIEDILRAVRNEGLPMVCVTGGEPLFQEGTVGLVSALLDERLSVDVETNGSKDLAPLVRKAPGAFLSVDVKTPSSGEEGSFLTRNLGYVKGNGQLKFVIRDGTDIEFAMSFLKEKKPMTDIILTPCNNKDGGMTASILMDALKKLRSDEGWLLERTRLMVQTQKVIWGDGKRGV